MNKIEELKYEEAFERLERIVERMDDALVPLDELMKLYEEGAALAGHCEKLLNEYEAKLTVLAPDEAPQASCEDDEEAPF